MGQLTAEANISIPDLFDESVDTDILQRRTLRWLVNVEVSSKI
jgi:hypothetical protein